MRVKGIKLLELSVSKFIRDEGSAVGGNRYKMSACFFFALRQIFGDFAFGILALASEVGLKLVSTGTGLGAVMVKLTAPEVPPPGVGLNTLTLTVPAVAMSVAVIAAANCVALT